MNDLKIWLLIAVVIALAISNIKASGRKKYKNGRVTKHNPFTDQW